MLVSFMPTARCKVIRDVRPGPLSMVGQLGHNVRPKWLPLGGRNTELVAVSSNTLSHRKDAWHRSYVTVLQIESTRLLMSFAIGTADDQRTP